MSNYMVHHIKKMLYMYSEKLGAGTIMVFATLLLFANSGFSQEVSGSTQNGTPQAPVTSNDTVAAADRTTPAKSQSSKSNLSSFTKTVETAGLPRMSQASDPDNWQFEIRPYIWLAGETSSCCAERLRAHSSLP